MSLDAIIAKALEPYAPWIPRDEVTQAVRDALLAEGHIEEPDGGPDDHYGVRMLVIPLDDEVSS